MAVLLQRTAEELSWEFLEILREAELTPAAYNVLRILRGAGELGASCNEVSDRLIKRDADITRLLDRLEKRGLIGRSRSESDRRIVHSRITAAGLKLLASLDEPVVNRHRELLGHVGEKKLVQLRELLETIRPKRS